MAKSVKQPVETPPYLKWAHLVDFPPIRNVKVGFNTGLNIIIGNNGAGKTRFISLLNELIQLYEVHTNGIGCEIMISAKKYEIKALFKAAPVKEDVRESMDRTPVLLVEASSGTTSVEGETLDDAIDDLIDELEPETLIVPSIYYSTLSIRHGIPYNNLYIIDTNADLMLSRRGAFLMTGESRKRPSEVESRLVQNMLYTLARTFRAIMTGKGKKPTQLISIENAKKRIAQIIDAFLLHISSAISLYSPLVKVKRGDLFQVYHNEVQDELIVKGLTFEYYTKKGGMPLPFSALSDGTKRLFYIITEILAPPPGSFSSENNLRDFTDESKIIFLEEPELGIHPKQLTKLLNLIREVSKDNQVIMTTHSPQVLDMLTEKELDRITMCTLDAKKGTQFHPLSRTKQQQAREYMKEVGFLSDYWRYSYLEETTAE